MTSRLYWKALRRRLFVYNVSKLNVFLLFVWPSLIITKTKGYCYWTTKRTLAS
uniref:Uncharacterized protein n=1 Tax=Romanomermis culicivorax TaxID=13658 RepID=A0A915KEF2_ROMCU